MERLVFTNFSGRWDGQKHGSTYIYRKFPMTFWIEEKQDWREGGLQEEGIGGYLRKDLERGHLWTIWMLAQRLKALSEKMTCSAEGILTGYMSKTPTVMGWELHRDSTTWTAFANHYTPKAPNQILTHTPNKPTAHLLLIKITLRYILNKFHSLPSLQMYLC